MKYSNYILIILFVLNITNLEANDKNKKLDRLFNDLKFKNATLSYEIEQKIWELWSTHPSDKNLTAMLAEGSNLVNKQKFPLDQLIEYQNEIKEDSRHINISISYFLNSMSISKKKIDNDSLFISLNELSNFDVFKDNKEFTSLVLYKNTGLSLPKDTVLNAKYSKNLLLIEITNYDYEQILTK